MPTSLRAVSNRAGNLPSQSDHEPCPAAGVLEVHDEAAA
jgi:hypothetical protein